MRFIQWTNINNLWENCNWNVTARKLIFNLINCYLLPTANKAINKFVVIILKYAAKRQFSCGM